MNSKNRFKRIIGRLLKIVVLMVFVVSFGFISSRSVYADGDGWVGGENGGLVHGTGGGGISDGLSWIYYETVQETSQSISFGSSYTSVNLSHYPTATISSVCSDLGGFWHYGGNYKALRYRYDSSRGYFGDYNNMNRYYTKKGYYGHWITMPYGYYGTTEKAISEFDLHHDIYDMYAKPGDLKNDYTPIGDLLYTATISATTDDEVEMPSGNKYTILEMLNISWNYYNNITPITQQTFDSIKKGTYAFCFNESMLGDYYGLSAGWATEAHRMQAP